ncbi:hypothetical protein DVH24_011414 [Malus domestica]|uniref:Glycolipid transfer protein domain-containing protein n=1 Tax=Malus domestica TaxID=3750 RepID=A0A498JT59_MALDO|nr:hypothetical protein DVH24_011414 [Malus domestica]
MSKRKAAAAGPIKESSQTTKVKETDVSLSAWIRKQESFVANYTIILPLGGPAPDRESLFTPVLEMLELVRSPSGEIRTLPFLVACRHTAPITLQFGEPLNHVRTSIFACAVPMERIYQSNPSKFEYLYSLVNHDVKTNTLFNSTSVSLVWLTRYMDFLVELFRNLREHPPDWVTIRAVYNAYAKTLIKWHDEKIVLTLIPLHLFGDLGLFLGNKYAREKDLLLKVIGGNGDVMGDMEKFCTSFTPLLKQNHEFLAGVDDLKLFRASLVAKVPSTYPKKRKMGKTMFAPALEELESVKSESKEILTKHFLESCIKILPVLAEFGTAVYPVTFDIRTCVVYGYSSDPSKFNYSFSLVQFETLPSKFNYSSYPFETFSLALLTRNMDFVVELFRNLLEHPEWFTIEACKDSYGKTLKIWLERKKWFNPNLPLKRVIPELSTDREKFMEKIEGNGDVMGDIKKFCSIFTPLIKEIDKFLASLGSDRIKLLIDGERAS